MARWTGAGSAFGDVAKVFMHDLERRKTEQRGEAERQRGLAQFNNMLVQLGFAPVQGDIPPEMYGAYLNKQNQDKAERTAKAEEQAKLQEEFNFLKERHPYLADVVRSVNPQNLTASLIQRIGNEADKVGEVEALRNFGAGLNTQLKKFKLSEIDFSKFDNPQVLSAAINQGYSEMEHARGREERASDVADDRAYDKQMRDEERAYAERERARQNAYEERKWNERYNQQHPGLTPFERETISIAQQRFKANPNLARAYLAGGVTDKKSALSNEYAVLMNRVNHTSDKSVEAVGQGVFEAAQMAADFADQKDVQYNRGMAQTRQIQRDNALYQEGKNPPPTQRAIDFMSKTGRNRRMFNSSGDVQYPDGSTPPGLGDMERAEYPGFAGKVLGAGADMISNPIAMASPARLPFLEKIFPGLRGQAAGMGSAAKTTDYSIPAFVRNGVNPNRPGPQNMSMVKWNPDNGKRIETLGAGEPQRLLTGRGGAWESTPFTRRDVMSPEFPELTPLTRALPPHPGADIPMEVKTPIFNRMLPVHETPEAPQSFSFAPADDLAPSTWGFLDRRLSEQDRLRLLLERIRQMRQSGGF